MKNFTQFLAISFFLLLNACGGGGSSTPPSTITPPPPVTQEQPKVVSGPISGFGSIIVNGVHYNTDNANFTVDDSTGTQADLAVGQIVELKTLKDAQGNERATDVEYDDAVQGSISAIDTTSHTFVVLGQTVIINNNTSFDDQIQPASINGLSVGDVVEVSGEVNADGDIVAFRIEPESAQKDSEVHGTVTALDTSAQTFVLGQLTVNYSQATFTDFGANGIANGDYIEAKGSTFDNSGALIATIVEFEHNDDVDDRVGSENEDGEIEGFITEFTSASSFKVSDIPVITDTGTQFDGGTSTDLALNVRIEVEGVFDANGALVADKIQFEGAENASDEISLASTLDSINQNNQTFVIFGVEFTADTSTRFEDKSDAGKTTFSFSDLATGDFLEVDGYLRVGSGFYAEKIERHNSENEHEVEAIVDNVSTDSLIASGITINTDANTQFEDSNEQVISQTEFFNTVVSGDKINAEGQKTASNNLLAQKLSIKHLD